MARVFSNKRFIIILAAAVILLCAAVWLNLGPFKSGVRDVSGAEDTDGAEEPAEETMLTVYNDYFNAFRAERSEVRAQEIDYLKSMINGKNVDAESMEQAQSRLMELVSNMEKEFTIESRIRSKGFLDAAATFRADSVTVVVDGETLTDEEVARILDIVMTETGLPASAVKISLGG